MQQVYTVEYVLDDRVRRGKLQYLLKYEGYGLGDCSWEPEEHVLDELLLRSYAAHKRSGLIVPGEREETYMCLRSIRGECCLEAGVRSSDKARSAGLLVAARPCGVIVGAQELLRVESATQVCGVRVLHARCVLIRSLQVVGFLYDLTRRMGDQEFDELVVFYDNACTLRRFMELRHARLQSAVRAEYGVMCCGGGVRGGGACVVAFVLVRGLLQVADKRVFPIADRQAKHAPSPPLVWRREPAGGAAILRAVQAAVR